MTVITLITAMIRMAFCRSSGLNDYLITLITTDYGIDTSANLSHRIVPLHGCGQCEQKE